MGRKIKFIKLTEREVQVMNMRSAGFKQKHIGKELGISQSRVFEICKSLKKKIGKYKGYMAYFNERYQFFKEYEDKYLRKFI